MAQLMQNWVVRKPVAASRGGVVVAQSGVAAAVGAEILAAGGSAVEGDRNMHGPGSFAIPSAVKGYALAVERFGRMPWRDLVAPAVALARQGLPVDWWVTLKTAAAAEDLRRYDESSRIWLPDDLPPVCPSSGEPPALMLGRLADTLARLAGAGPDDFYQGEIAQAIAADSAAAGGVLSATDLAECRARIV